VDVVEASAMTVVAEEGTLIVVVEAETSIAASVVETHVHRRRESIPQRRLG
jgi:hypothetical protein